MANWRDRSPALDKPGTSSDFFSNFQHYGNSNPSPSPPNSSSNFYEKRYFGLHRERRCLFSELVDLIELSSKDSSEIVLELIMKRKDFANFLKSNLESDWIVMTITMLSKACLTSFGQIKLELLKITANAQFLQTLANFLRNLQHEAKQNRDGNKHFWSNPEEFLGNLIFVCETIIDIIPTEIVDILQKLLKVVDYIVAHLSQKGNIKVSQKTKGKITVLRKKLDLLNKQSQSDNRADESSKAAINTFRNLSACFTREELSTWISELTTTDIVEERNTFINVDHYLEVQSRLMIKGFIVSLQEEIDKCFEQTKCSCSLSKSSPIRIYPDVVFRSMVFINHEAGMIMNFSNQESVDEIFSKRSKCFKWGSTVCFTKDNFVSVFIGWVIEKNYEQKQLIVGFENDNSYVLNGLYTLAEFNISFPHCYIGLKALQCITKADFPMERYLIDAVPITEQPNYLNKKSSIYTIQGSKVKVFGNNWPTADQLKLDPTQYTAFKAALTQKFVMIQGAHGTGKTYLGFKIVKTLLHNDNRKIWYTGTPILIVCLSNQVLDTFLEGLIPTTSKIIRVGKTESKKLTDYSLTRIRNYADWRLLYIGKKLKRLQLMLKEYNKCLNQIINFNIILHFKVFKSIDDKLKTSWFSRASDEDHFAWLFDEQNEDLHSIEISEVIKQITDEKEHIASLNNNTILNENILPESHNLVLFSKMATWFKIVKICNQVQEVDTHTDEMEKLELETQLKHLWRNYQYFKMKMIHREFPPATTEPIHVNYNSPHSMDPNDRWNLYFSWLNLYKQYVEKNFLQLRCEHREQSNISTEIQNILDLEEIKRSLVLGMTLHTAARLRTTLQALKCRIVVVQEASDVSESYTLFSLTKQCEHLILMGDPPMIDSISLNNSNSFLNAGPSIIERMLQIKVQCNTLGFQHRMRPEISQLLAPYFYPEMKNHHSITNFPKVLGIPSSIFFVNQEHQRDVEEYNSKTNLHESKYLINLARYLRQVGYAPEDITILASFSGQMHVLWDEKEKYQDLLLKDIKINSVDSYQGEACKIILLSLVRNNQEGKIGCLKSESYIKLALSRATEAFYMVGNIDLLCQNSEVWAKINEVLVEQNCIKNYLPVCCKINPNHVTKIIQPEDFDQVPEEVCSKICGRLLNCGHACCKQCHSTDGDHNSLSCTELCKM